MRKGKKKSIIMAMIGAIIGIMISVVFSNSSNLLAVAPVAGIIGGLIGTFIDKRKGVN